jgi:hypothetical protein
VLTLKVEKLLGLELADTSPPSASIIFFTSTFETAAPVSEGVSSSLFSLVFSSSCSYGGSGSFLLESMLK